MQTCPICRNEEEECICAKKQNHINEEVDDTVAPCPQCGRPMIAVRGLKSAICQNCGFKDSCCY